MTTENKGNFSEILAALSEACGCDPLKPGEDGSAFLELDGNMVAQLATTDAEETGIDTLVVGIAVGPAPAEQRELLYGILSGNYMGAETADGTLAIDPETNLLILQRIWGLPKSPDAFVAAFGRLVGAARRWRDRLIDPGAPAADGGNAVFKV